MKIEEIKYSLKNILQRKLRSGLTVLSILVGIAAIYALISFGLGIQSYVNDVADQAGRDKLFIMAKGIGAPGSDENFFISKDDISFVGKIKGVDDIAGIYVKAGKIAYKKEARYNFVAAIDPSKKEFIEGTMGLKISKGRSLKTYDSNKAVLGYNYQFDKKVFENSLKTGDKIELNGVAFEVIGFYKELGNPHDDANIYLTDKAMESLYPNIKDKFAQVLIRAGRNENVAGLAERIEEKLRKHKNQEKGKEDFYVQTFEDALKTFSTIINVINGVLALIALISVVVASVNIMNTMYTAVLERTKEIGVMKAIGARNSKILLIFMFESGSLGFIGGIAGVILGYIIAAAGGNIAAASGYALLKPVFPWYLTFGCLLFSAMIGTGAGLLPSRHASKQKPVDALRYE